MFPRYDRPVRRIRDRLLEGVLGVVGLLAGVASAVALLLAAALPPIIGVLAVATAPVRALLERLQRSQA
jgi:hypothetical protein